MLLLAVFLVALVGSAVGPDPCCLRVSPYHIQALAQRMAQRFQALEFRAQDLRNVFSAFQAVHGNVSTRLRFLEADHAELYAEVLRMNTRLQILEAEKRIEEYRQRLKLDTDWYLSQRGRRHGEVTDYNSDSAISDHQNKISIDSDESFTDTLLPDFEKNFGQTANITDESVPSSSKLPDNSSVVPILNPVLGADSVVNISNESLSSPSHKPAVNASDSTELFYTNYQDFRSTTKDYSETIVTQNISSEPDSNPQKLVNSSDSPEVLGNMLNLENIVNENSEAHGINFSSNPVSSSHKHVVNSSDTPLKLNLFDPLPVDIENTDKMFRAALGTNDSVAPLEDSRRSSVEFMDFSVLHSKNITMSNLVPLPETSAAQIRPLEVTSDNTTNDLNFFDKLLNDTVTNDTSGMMLIDAALSDAELQEALRSLNEMLVAARREDPESGEDNEKVLLKRALALALETLERTSDACLQLVNATTDAFEGLANEERFR